MFVIPPQFEFAESFSEGLARVTLPGKQGTGFIDPSGKCVLRLSQGAERFVEGVAASCTLISRLSAFEPRCGFIDKTGRFVIPPQRGRAMAFSDGLALFQNDDYSWFYIDHSGKTVLTIPLGSRAWPFVDGLTLLQSPQGSVYVDKTGKVLAAYQQ
jgi:hypothetical protein